MDWVTEHPDVDVDVEGAADSDGDSEEVVERERALTHRTQATTCGCLS